MAQRSRLHRRPQASPGTSRRARRGIPGEGSAHRELGRKQCVRAGSRRGRSPRWYPCLGRLLRASDVCVPSSVCGGVCGPPPPARRALLIQGRHRGHVRWAYDTQHPDSRPQRERPGDRGLQRRGDVPPVGPCRGDGITPPQPPTAARPVFAVLGHHPSRFGWHGREDRLEVAECGGRVALTRSAPHRPAEAASVFTVPGHRAGGLGCQGLEVPCRWSSLDAVLARSAPRRRRRRHQSSPCWRITLAASGAMVSRIRSRSSSLEAVPRSQGQRLVADGGDISLHRAGASRWPPRAPWSQGSARGRRAWRTPPRSGPYGARDRP